MSAPSNAVRIEGTVHGGPLDGQAFTFPGTAAIRTAVLHVCLGGEPEDWHSYALESTDHNGNVLRYEGPA
jgi:hypothetical protein